MRKLLLLLLCLGCSTDPSDPRAVDSESIEYRGSVDVGYPKEYSQTVEIHAFIKFDSVTGNVTTHASSMGVGYSLDFAVPKKDTTMSGQTFFIGEGLAWDSYLTKEQAVGSQAACKASLMLQLDSSKLDLFIVGTSSFPHLYAHGVK